MSVAPRQPRVLKHDGALHFPRGVSEQVRRGTVHDAYGLLRLHAAGLPHQREVLGHARRHFARAQEDRPDPENQALQGDPSRRPFLRSPLV